MALFSRLVRFVAKNGQTYYGDAVLPRGVSDVGQARKARIIHGDIFGKHEVSKDETEIGRFLAPLAPNHISTVRCLGLNYADHAEETGMEKPANPVLFYKPATSLGGPVDNIPVHAVAQDDDCLDYESELVVTMGSKCTDVTEDEALDYVLGYSVGNDVSHRKWQLQGGGGQWSLGKGFDGWAPFGPGIVTGKAIDNAQALKIWTKVNGETRQSGTTSNMLFSIRTIISFLSRGVTLMPGDVIFTGTPAGVGMARQQFLQDGDVVEVGVENIGTCTNKVVFQKVRAKM